MSMTTGAGAVVVVAVVEEVGNVEEEVA